MVDINELAKELEWTVEQQWFQSDTFQISVSRDSIVWQVEQEVGYEDFLLDLTDDVIIEMGYSPLNDFDSIKLRRVGRTTLQYDDADFAVFEVTITFNRY